MPTLAAPAPAPAAPPPADPARLAAAHHLERWRAGVDAHGDGRWAKRLGWDGLTEADVLASLAAAFEGGEASDPSGLVAAAYGPGRDPAAESVWADRALDEAPPAFGHLVVPLVRAARAALEAEAGPALAALSADARADLERSLLRRLAAIIGQAAYGTFSPLRDQQRSLTLSALLGGGATRPSDTVYRAFIGHMVRGGMAGLFGRYPVAARLCSVVAGFWVRFGAALAARLTADAERLAGAFGTGAALGPATGCSADLGDTHNEGEAVCVLHFGGGLRVVYKPRPLGLEAAYQDVATWLNGRLGEGYDLYAPRCLHGDGYGWVEFISNDECAAEAEVEAYYRRLGVALGVVYCLNGNDFHYENVIAHGAHPVLIDMEALFSPRFSMGGDPTPRHAAEAAAAAVLRQSVFTTGLLPSLKRLGAGVSIDMGAMGGAAEATEALPIAFWDHAHTDLMRLAYRLEPVEAKANQPRFRGERRFATEFADAIDDGFARAYAAFADGGAGLFDALAPALEDQPVRFIFRPTNLYASLLGKALHPKYLRHEAARQLVFEVLSRPLLANDERPQAWALLGPEFESLAQADVPLFEGRCGSRDLHVPGGPVLADFFDASALDACRDRLAALRPDDLERQRRLVRLALAGRAAASPLPPWPAPSAPAVGPADAATDYARRVTDALWDARVAGPDGGGAWYTLDYDPTVRRHAVHPSLGLLSGGAGVGLFGAAAWAATGDERARGLAHAAFQTAADALGDPSALGLGRADAPLGMGGPLAGPLFALAHGGRLLNDARYVDAAGRAAAWAADADFDPGARADVAGGFAGLVLALLAVEAQAGAGAALEAARRVGDALLAAGPAGPDIHAPLPAAGGLLYGPAGRALALSRLGRRLGEDRYLDAARAALDEAAPVGTDPLALSWATGLAGHALVALDDPAMAASLAAAEALAMAAAPSTDEPAGGTLSRAAVLDRAAVRLGAPALAAAAEALAQTARARAAGPGWAGAGWGADVFHPGLHRGPAGVAYLLLQRAGSAGLPCILTFSS